MRNKLFCVLLLAVCASISFSSDTAKAPKIKINDNTFDFGYAPEGANMAHEYTIYNIGTETLEIQRIRTTCGCANAPIKKTRIEPGDSTIISIIFNSTKYFHKTSKSAFINTNDLDNPTERINFVADMDSTKNWSLVANPRIITIGKNSGKTATTVIKNTSQTIVDVQIIDYYHEYLQKPTIDKTILAPGETATITANLVSNISDAEQMRASFTVVSTDKSGTEIARTTVPIATTNK